MIHAGSHRGMGEEAGIERIAGRIAGILRGAPAGVEVLVENSAGSGHALAGSPAALGRLLDTLPPQVGTCIDTAHLWGSGCDIASAQGVDHALALLDDEVGLARIRVLHVNDSAVALGSRRDVHAHLGEGAIGAMGLSAWLAHPALHSHLIILETPLEDDPTREAARCAIARLLMQGDSEGAREKLAALRNDQCSGEEA